VTDTDEVLAWCRRLGVGLRADGGRLVWRAPPGVMTAALRAAIAAHRGPLLAGLGGAVPDVPDGRPGGPPHQGPGGPPAAGAEVVVRTDVSSSSPLSSPDQVPEVPDVPDPGDGLALRRPSGRPRGDDVPVCRVNASPSEPSGTSGTSGTARHNPFAAQELCDLGHQGPGPPPSGTSGTTGSSGSDGLTVFWPDGVCDDPPPGRRQVARWPHTRWAAWRARSAAILDQPGRPRSATAGGLTEVNSARGSPISAQRPGRPGSQPDRPVRLTRPDVDAPWSGRGNAL
jgi:hypothetical protein